MNPTKQGLKPAVRRADNATLRVLAHESNKTRIETLFCGMRVAVAGQVLAHESNKTRIETPRLVTLAARTSLS